MLQYNTKAPERSTGRNTGRRPLPDDLDFADLNFDAVNFLHHLYAPYYETLNLFVEIRCLANRGAYGPREWFPTDPLGFLRAVYQMQKWRDTNDVYMGVLPRVYGGGTAHHLRLSAWLWVDIDAGSETRAEARALLERYTHAGIIPEPHLLVGSGGGLHAYWLLTSPVPVQTQPERERFQNVSKRLVHLIGGEPDKAHACSAATDAARILRLPGSFNRKRETPRPVELLRCDKPQGRCQTLAWWEANLPSVAVPVPAVLTGRRARRQAPIQEPTLAPATVSKMTFPTSDGQKHKTMVTVAVAARKRGLDETAIRACAEQVGIVSGVPMDDPAQQSHLEQIVQWTNQNVQPDYTYISQKDNYERTN